MADANGKSQPRHPDEKLAALERELGEERERCAALTLERAELRRANDAANRARDQLLATISHELRTPLNAIVGWAHLLQSSELPPEEIKRGLAAIVRGAEAQARMLGTLLDISRIISGNTRLSIQAVDLGPLVDEAMVAARAEFQDKGVTVSAQGSAGLVQGDPERLRQVLSTLLSNAMRYTPAGGTVEITTAPSGEFVELRVRDTGSGVAPEMLSSFFDDFRHAEAGAARQRGLGLGLGVVRRLIELQGGSVSAESAGIDLGTTVLVRLPVASTEPAENEDEDLEVARPTPTSLSGLRVLVAEDDAISRDLILKILDAAGARVVAVPSGQEALQIFGRFKPDVLLSDLEMPGTDGYGLIRQLRAQPPALGGRTPAVALTGFVETEDRARAAGFDQHISKPVGPARLIAVVAELSGRAAVPPPE